VLAEDERRRLETWIEPIRRALGERRCAELADEARRMTVDRAIELCHRGDVAGTAIHARAPERLSPRAQEIARLVARGLTNRQIAETLVLQESTVANHLRRIYERLGLTGRVQLTAWASEHGLTGNVST
jgi:DNA-binding NarL/FixJ family response regulator